MGHKRASPFIDKIGQGRNSYARALVEVSSKEALLDSLVVAIPYPIGSGHSLEKIDIEYEWKPPRCETCKVFYHNDDGCPKRVKPVVKDKLLVDEEGFVEAYKKKGKGKLQGTNRQVDGIRFQKPKVSYYYRSVTKPKNGGASTFNQSNTDSPTVNVDSTCNGPNTDPTCSTAPPRDDQVMNNNWVDDTNLVELKNSFDVLKEQHSILEPMIGTAGTPEERVL
ncbi:zinc knuckle CX2CX4HX4C [Artemisia annua]|uniref:Zinc knuckle CX2CX4HX4C n=1 Tax=Artemisia annua TaxID=35608 RepID=A0A2U1LZT8_ARTAN|nr:zinc knuckle CX2CX4HX4C [Artemisia annua]